MKKLISLLIVAIFVVSCISPSCVFADTRQTPDETDFVREAAVLSAIGVYTATVEDNFVTRGAMIQAFVNLSGIDFDKEEKIFFDVAVGSEYCKAVTTAYHLRLLDTPRGARLGVDSYIGYEETLKMAVRLLGYGDVVNTNAYSAVVYKTKALKNFAPAKPNAITEGEAIYVVDENTCISCGACADTCPVGAPEEN